MKDHLQLDSCTSSFLHLHPQKSSSTRLTPGRLFPVEKGKELPLDKLERVESLWFPDGNLVRGAENLAFRVYVGMLAKKSTLPAELCKQPPAGHIDGCPVLRLPHRGQETNDFLGAIFDFESAFDPGSFYLVAGVLRLSAHSSLKRTALAHLSTPYSTQLRAFPAGLGPSYARDAQIAPLVRLARSLDVAWVLPVALYRFCVELSGDTLFGDLECGLSTEDSRRCYDAATALRRARTVAVLARFRGRMAPCAGCTRAEACRGARMLAGAALLEGGLDCIPDLAAVWAPSADLEEGLYDVCLAEMHEWYEGARRTLWDGLPALLGLPEWSVLNAMKEQALQQGAEANDDEEETY
ncbi:hypothetical protein C8J57DRAFT_1225669 [Mycena rebaudengoi]|nr:hypothetical protein C8J57DRAFT_1225669 [Mycena rebaudengoi]